jgi:tetratricopeptide (TPR) repeat protein
MTVTQAIWQVLLLLTCPCTLWADDVWVGKEVFAKRASPNLTRTDEQGNVIIVGKMDLMFAEVREEKGEWVKVQVRDIAGWIRKDEVLQVKDGIPFFTQKIQSNDDIASAYANRAWIWYKKGEYNIAIKDAEEAIRMSPSAFTYTARGQAWQAKKDYDTAIKDFDEAIRLDPKYGYAYSCRGIAWLNKNDYDQATRDLDEAIRLDPKDLTAYLSSGVVWYYRKDYDKAIKNYDEIIRLDPKCIDAYFNRGLTFREKEDFDKAIKDYNEVIRLDPKYVNAYFRRGLACRYKKDNDKAIQDFDQVIRLDPKYVNAYYYRGVAWDDKKDYDKAIQDFDQVIRFDPKYVNTYYLRGNAYRNKKDYDKAIQDFDEVIRLDPKHVNAYTGRGWVWLDKFDATQALTSFEAAPDQKDASVLLGRSASKLLLNQPQAATGFQELLDRHGWKQSDSIYAVVLGSLAARRAGDTARAESFLKEAEGKLDTAWPYPVVEYLRGKIDEPKLLATAKDDNERTEAHCYVALHLLTKGKTAEAIEHFRWVQEHGATEYTEYTISRFELHRLEKSKK